MIPYIIKSFRGGISDEANKGIAGSFKNGYNLNIHGRADTLTCNLKMVSIGGTVITDLIKFFVTGSDGSLYAFGDQGKIYSKAENAAVTDLYTFVKRVDGANGDIKGAALWGTNANDYYLMWATATSLARKRLYGSNSGMDWADRNENWSTTLTSTTWHTMKRACGALMIANERYLAMYAYDGSYTPQAMNIEPGQVIKALSERDDYVIMGSGNADEDDGYIWSWITTALNYVQKKKVPVAGVNALIDSEVMLLSGGYDGQLVYSDFVNTVPLHMSPFGGEVYPGAVTLYHGVAMFGMQNSYYDYAGAGLWTYGRVAKNRPMALNWEYRLSADMAGSSISRLGAVTMYNGLPYASWRTNDGTTVQYGVDCASTTMMATAVYEGLEFDAQSPHLKKRFATAKLIIEPLPVSCSIAFKYKMDGATSWTTAKTASGSATFTNTGATSAEFIIGTEGKVAEFGVTLTPYLLTSPEVRAIIVYIDDSMEKHG